MVGRDDVARVAEEARIAGTEGVAEFETAHWRLYDRSEAPYASGTQLMVALHQAVAKGVADSRTVFRRRIR